MSDNTCPKTASAEEINFARRSFVQAAGAVIGILLTGCGGGSGGSSQTNTVSTTTITTPPVITLQPSNQTVNPGERAIFEVGASGTPSVTYQWQRNGIVIPGATEVTYVTPLLALQDSGAAYAVLVSNDAGVVQSDTVTVKVSTAGITVDSTSVTVDALAALNQ